MPSVTTVLGPIYVEDSGPANLPTALLWSSLFTDHTLWDRQVEALRSAGWRTLALDPPGQGKSPGPDRTFTMEECTQVALQLLDAMGVDKPVLVVGTSWGGMIAPRVALAAPERVSGLVMFNTTAEPADFWTKMGAILLTWMLRFKTLDKLVNDIVVSVNLTEDNQRKRPEVAANFIRSFRSWDRARLIMTVRSVLVDRDGTLDRLQGVKVPTLVVSGSEDKTLPTPHAVRMAERIPGARQVEVPGCAHLVTLEAPDVANRLMLELAEAVC